MKMDYLDKIDLFDVKKTNDRIYLIDIESSIIQTIDVTEKYDRDDLLKNNHFISYAGHELNRVGSVTLYTIVDRVVDERKNLLVFVKQETKNIEKS